MKRWVSYVALGLAVAVAGGGVWVATVDIDLPAPTGAFAVGRMHGETGLERRVAYTIYHPAMAGTGSVGDYMPDGIADATAQRDLGAFSSLPDPWGRVRHHVRDGAEWAPGAFPLIVFSPGADVQPQYYSSVAAGLASHGYVVATVSHPGLTPFIAYADGAVAVAQEAPLPGSAEEAIRQHEERIDAVAGDILAVVAHLRSSGLAAHLDGQVATFGHSLGGAGAAAAAVNDASIVATGDMDGSLGRTVRDVELARPVLFMTDGGPVAPADQAARQAFVRGGEPGLKVTLHGASHMTFATDTNFLEETVPFNDSDELGALEAHRDIMAPLLEFFGNAFAR